MSKYLPKHILLIFLLFNFFSLSLLAQLKEVEFSGAIGSKDWTKGWTNYKPVEVDYPTTSAVLSGVISTNTVLTRKSTYLLKGFVYVTNNSTLYIEPGTIIRGDKDSRAVLVICKGSKIRAIGTETDPIIFTSNQPKGLRNPGDWGGIIILGNAGTNNESGSSIAEGIANPELGAFGGGDPDDNSGIMKYVRIEFPGFKYINNEKEHNGLTLCAVGRKTKIEFIQISFSKDDSFEWFGGNVSCNNLISFKATDDDFDVTNGYSGTLQFGIALRNATLKDVSGSSGIEADSYNKGEENSYNNKILTRCIFSNFTLISPEPTREEIMNNITQNKYAIAIKNNAQIWVYNSVIMGFQNGFYIGGADSEGYIEDNSIKLKNNFVVGAIAPIKAEVSSQMDLNTWFVTPEFSNIFYKVYDKPVVQDPFNQIAPVFTPVAGSFLLKSSSFKDLKKVTDVASFYDKVDYVGAFGTTDWTKSWTNFNPNAAAYLDKPIVEVSGRITSDTKWSSSNTYLLKGIVWVENQATLTIEPGTLIKGDIINKGALVIMPKSKIMAEGTAEKPIIFTSNQKSSLRKPGDWGGLVILGSGKTNSKDFTKTFKLLGAEPILFGGNRFWEESGSIKYMRIEFAGALMSGASHKMNGLALGGVNKLNMDFIQVSYSNSNAIEFWGGAVNAKHIVCLGTVDDDLEIEEGYSGVIQYGVILRDPLTADIKKSNSIESTSGENENFNFVATNAILTNMSIIGPLKTRNSQYNLNLNSALHLSQNSAISLVNSYIIGFPTGIILDGEKVDFNAWSQLISFKNNIIAGCFNPLSKISSGAWDFNTLFKEPSSRNRIFNEATELKIKDPFNITTPGFLPLEGSPCLNTQFIF
jgi:hypothetical protein